MSDTEFERECVRVTRVKARERYLRNGSEEKGIIDSRIAEPSSALNKNILLKVFVAE